MAADPESIAEALVALEITDLAPLKACNSLVDEFHLIKRTYFRKILVAHPDKGGDPAEFRLVNTAFELLRSVFEEGGVASFANAAEAKKKRQGGGGGGGGAYRSRQTPDVRPWQFYKDAEQEAVPAYKVELAKSGRSKCTQKTKTAKKCAAGTPFIEKGSVRVGSLDDESGTYGRWMHLDCWRVPVRIWQGLPHMTTDGGADQDEKFAEALASMNEVLFCGFSQLNDEQKALIIEHVKNRENWARAPGKKVGGDEESTAKRKKGSSSGNKGNEQPEESLVAIKEEKPTVTTKKQQRAGKKRAAPLDEEDEHHEDEVYGVKIKSEPKSRRAAAAAPKRGRAATAAAVAAVEAYISNENIMIDQNAASPPPPVKKEKKVRAKKSKTASTIPLSSSSQPPPHTSSSSSSSQAIAIYEKKQQSQEHQVAPVDGGSSSRFMVPKPGVNGAQPGFLQGKTVVMTGLFPQIGGGTGLNLGKDRLRDMLESFGAKVTSAVSGKTNLLVVGEEPGSSKVSKARASGKCQLIRVEDLVGSIHGRVALEQATPPQIEAFSSGYFGNALRIGGDGYDGW